MKNIIITTVLLLLTSMGYAQQDVLKYISNSYITSSNSLNTMSAIENYRNQIEYPAITPDEISDKTTYYKISYKPETGSASFPGLLDITYDQFSGANDGVEKEFEGFYNMLLSDSDPADFIREVVKTSDANGGYVFRKNDNTVYFYIKSNPSRGRVVGLIQINNLTDAQMKAFLKDFIQKMKFK